MTQHESSAGTVTAETTAGRGQNSRCKGTEAGVNMSRACVEEPAAGLRVREAGGEGSTVSGREEFPLATHVYSSTPVLGKK